MASVFSWHRHFISCQQLEVYFSSWWMRPTVNRLEIDRKCKKQKIGELSRNGKQTVLNLTKIEAFSKCGKQQFHFFQKWNQIVKGSRQYFANHITTVWKLRKFTPNLQNFREINLWYNSLGKKYFDGIFAKRSWGKIFEITTLWSRSKISVKSTLYCNGTFIWQKKCWFFRKNNNVFLRLFHDTMWKNVKPIFSKVL